MSTSDPILDAPRTWSNEYLLATYGPEEGERLIQERIQWVLYGAKIVDYRRYIQSAEWKLKADAAKERAGHRCQICNSPEKVEAHHRTYERLGNERPDDIVVLCDGCHELFHRNGKLKR